MKTFINSLKYLPFENSTYQLPVEVGKNNSPRKVVGYVYSEVIPEPKDNPRLVAYSKSAFSLINVELDPHLDENVQILCGNIIPLTSKPIAHCYCGYQFGQWAGQLGDGRAITLGDVQNQELQLKGSGLTPYSRFADGKAVIRSSVREYLCSEAMFALGIPTTRAASLVVTDSKAQRDMFYDGHPKEEKCAVVLRMAETLIRFGSFEIEKDQNPKGSLVPQLWKYIRKYFISNDPFQEIVHRTAKLVALWQCYGFCHGVLNTDNMSIVGLTIDYGPFGFMDYFNRTHICNHSDKEGRYCYENQPAVCEWNLLRLCEALDSVIPIAQSKEIVNQQFKKQYQLWYYFTMLQKLGLVDTEQAIEATQQQQNLIDQLFQILHECSTNYTKLFRTLMKLESNEQFEEYQFNDNDKQVIDELIKLSAPKEVYLQRRKPIVTSGQLKQLIAMKESKPQMLLMMGVNEQFIDEQIQIHEKYNKYSEQSIEDRLSMMKLLWNDWVSQYKCQQWPQGRLQMMSRVNPYYVLTNNVLQQVINECELNDNYELLNQVQTAMENPYIRNDVMDKLFDRECFDDVCVSCSS